MVLWPAVFINLGWVIFIYLCFSFFVQVFSILFLFGLFINLFNYNFKPQTFLQIAIFPLAENRHEQ
jgi:hypothetical protein